MLSTKFNNLLISVTLPILLYNSCDAIKCFECNSANNSACLDMHVPKFKAIVPVVDCSQFHLLPRDRHNEAFCRKITQTILHSDKTPEVRITRTCGWVKHKRECYKADNQDHLETVCQCFGDMCNSGTVLQHFKITDVATFAALFMAIKTWRGYI